MLAVAMCGMCFLSTTVAVAPVSSEGVLVESSVATLAVIEGNNYRNNIIQGANGTVSVSSLLRPAGAIVTVTYEPDEGYELKTLEVLTSKYLPVPLMPAEGNTFQYEQPTESVTITASFQRTSPEPSALDYDDVAETDWFYPYVDEIVKRGAMTGTSETTFDPQGHLTRGAVAVIIANVQKVDLESVTDDFLEDVDSSDWYFEAANWCVRNGIFVSAVWNEFEGDRAITREELIHALYHVGKYTGFYTTVYDTSNLSVFADAHTISENRVDAMSWGVKNRYMSGDTEDNLNPQATATRAEICVILSTFLKAHDFYVLYGRG